MAETRTSPGAEGLELQDKKLVSWKEIASHLGREVRTVQRWERSEGLPVYRHEHLRKSTVYAFANELDDWIKKRQPKDDPEADAAFEPEPDVAEALLGSENGDDAKTDVPPVQPSPPKWKRPVLAAAAAAVLCFTGYGIYRWIHPRILPPEKLRLVVLPFANLSGDPKQDYFSAGLTDEMITQLGSLDPQHLGVIAAASSSALAGKPIADIRRALDVQYALEGSVRREGNRVRIDVQLIQAGDQTHLWADSYNRDLNDILLVQDEVAKAVANAIRLALSPSGEEAARSITRPSGGKAAPRSVNPEAYDAYLRGRFYWTNRGA